MKGKIWSTIELLAAFNLYCSIPFGRLHYRNPRIVAFAEMIGRSPSSVAWKLVNFARLDPDLKERGIKGASHGSKGEVEIWKRYSTNPASLSFESAKAFASFSGLSVEEYLEIDTSDLPAVGFDRERVVRTRANQHLFRKRVLAAYDFKCCLTGLEYPLLLNASHIVPWKDRESTRLNPRNGLCLNVLHDRAFDRGIFTVTPDFVVRFSNKYLCDESMSETARFVRSFDGMTINCPADFTPDKEFLEYHNSHVFESQGL